MGMVFVYIFSIQYNFQVKMFAEISGKKSKLFIVVVVTSLPDIGKCTFPIMTEKILKFISSAV